MTTAALILAAGIGARAGGGIAKQWRSIAGKRVIDWTVDAFASHPSIDRVVAVVQPDAAHHLPRGLDWTAGGTTRVASVRAGLEALAADPPNHVLIHDGARACVTPEVIDAVLEALFTGPAAAPGLPITDALWSVEAKTITGTHPRDGLMRAQTPQGFDFAAILQAHRTNIDTDAADDVAIALAAGLPVALTQGDAENIKITTPADFARAETILRGRHGRKDGQRI